MIDEFATAITQHKKIYIVSTSKTFARGLES